MLCRFWLQCSPSLTRPHVFHAVVCNCTKFTKHRVVNAYDSKMLTPKFVEIAQIVQMLKSVNKIIHTHNPALDDVVELFNCLNGFI